MRLNPEQQRAVDTTEGPVLVLAGAGTGKTRVLTARIARLMDRGVPPDRILAVTFTNKAAREMRERVAKGVGKKRAAEVVLGTFHAFCARALREAGERFSICDSSDQMSAARSALRDLHVPETRLHPRALLGQVSLGKSRCETWEIAAESDELLGQAWRRYEEHLRRGRTLDFDDLLLEGLALARRDAGLRGRFRYVLGDEYQAARGHQ